MLPDFQTPLTCIDLRFLIMVLPPSQNAEIVSDLDIKKIMKIERDRQMSILEEFIEIPVAHEKNIFGQFDAFAKKIERTLQVTLIARDGHTKILGEAQRVNQAKRVLEQLAELSKRGNTITEQNVDYAISLVFEDNEKGIVEIDKDIICHTLQGKPISRRRSGRRNMWMQSESK